jgi:plastocyanin
LRFAEAPTTAKAGTTTIKFTNSSSVAHNITVQQGTSGPVVGATPTFARGTKSLTLELKPGT